MAKKTKIELAKALEEKLTTTKLALEMACRKIVLLTENCPNTIFCVDLGECGNCEIGHFPYEIDNEVACMGIYYLQEAEKAAKEVSGDEDTTDAENGKEEEPGAGHHDSDTLFSQE